MGLANGSIATINGDFQYFPSVEAGVEMSVVGGLHQGCIKLNVLPDSPIQGAEDLVGARIAVDEIGGTPYQVALLWLAQNGISPDQVTFLPFNDGALELEALCNGQVEVAALWDPLATTAEVDGSTRVILDISTDEPFAGHFCCFLYASNKVLEEEPELIAAELRAYRKAQNWIHENPEEAVELVTEKQYVSIEDHDLAVELIKSYGYPSTDSYASGAWDIGGDVEYFAQALYDVGFLTTGPAESVQKAYAEGIGNMGPAVSAGGGSSAMGDLLGLGVGMAAMNAMAPQVGEMMKGFQMGVSGGTGAPAAEPQTVKCPKCGNPLPANAKFCLECGTKMEILAENEMICPACGKKTPKGKFCMECGHPLVNRCPNCGAEVPQGGKFCLECGTKLL